MQNVFPGIYGCKCDNNENKMYIYNSRHPIYSKIKYKIETGVWYRKTTYVLEQLIYPHFATEIMLLHHSLKTFTLILLCLLELMGVEYYHMVLITGLK
jgi:hypothetical protein